MSIIITNITRPATATGAHQYELRINLNPPIARFEHLREEGLATCLRRAADAVDAVNRSRGKKP